MRVRLNCAHRLLSDQRFAGLTVSEVAARCGFLEPSHFARRFRKAYGAGPTEFRTTSLNGGDPIGTRVVLATAGSAD
jgi:AraC-like DNA-binding protein